MRRDGEKEGELSGIRLPAIRGATLAPKRQGIAAFCRAMAELYPVFPNREVFLARRRRGDHGPVPVRFRAD